MRQQKKRAVMYSGPQKESRGRGQIKLAAALILIFIFLYWLGSGCLDRLTSGSINDYMGATDKIYDSTKEEARLFQQLMAPPADRKQLKDLLTALKKDSTLSYEKAKAIRPPKQMREAHSMLVFATELRREAFKDYEEVITNILTDSDSDVAVSQLMSTWQELVLADRAQAKWQENIKEELSAKETQERGSIAANRIMDPNLLDRGTAATYVELLRKQAALSVIHGLAIIELATSPQARLSNPENRLYTISAGSRIKVRATIENQGNQSETNLIVKMTLKSEEQPIEQIDQKVVDRLEPGQKQTVLFEPVSAKEEGIIYLLTVSISPVAEERVLDNNTLELKFVAT